MKHLYSATGVPSDLSSKWLRLLGERIHQRFSVSRPIAVAFVSDEEMEKLNTRYRGKHSVTDVLSFSYEEGDSRTLGEIILAESKLRKQAKEKKHSLEREFQVLVIHGTLHILGYDHEHDADAEVMESLEEEILEELEKTLAVS